MKALIQKFVQEEDGATMVEYGILVALIAAVVIVTVNTLGGTVNTTFEDVNTQLTNPGGEGGDGGAG